jgi:hypothetical protein
MRVSKFYGALLIALLAVGFIACNNTVSSTDASDNDGLDFIPGFEPGKTVASSANVVSSSSANGSSSSSVDESSSSVVESSSAEESSSSVEESSSSVDFSESKIQVDESGVAVITDEFLETISARNASEMDVLRDKYEDDPESVEGFSESRKRELAVDDLDYSKNEYYCYTDSEEWFMITKEKLLETKLPFLWDGSAYDLRDDYILDFRTACAVVYVKAI